MQLLTWRLSLNLFVAKDKDLVALVIASIAILGCDILSIKTTPQQDTFYLATLR